MAKLRKNWHPANLAYKLEEQTSFVLHLPGLFNEIASVSSVRPTFGRNSAGWEAKIRGDIEGIGHYETLDTAMEIAEQEVAKRAAMVADHYGYGIDHKPTKKEAAPKRSKRSSLAPALR